MPGGVLSGSELMFRVTQAWLEMGLEGKKKSRNAGSKKSHSALSDSLTLLCSWRSRKQVAGSHLTPIFKTHFQPTIFLISRICLQISIPSNSHEFQSSHCFLSGSSRSRQLQGRKQVGGSHLSSSITIIVTISRASLLL